MQGFLSKEISVGRDVLTGCKAVILKGVKVVGDGSVIAAGSIVTKDVPAKVIGTRSPS
jgi:acetyltransferase-like isoleucine patch superfamily enzyme